MIDIENQIITDIDTALTAAFPGIEILSDTSQTPSKFPCVYVTESDNYVYTRSIDSGSNENHAEVMYEINVYTNDVQGKKTKCKKIFNKVDEVMLNLGFIRLSKTPIPFDDATKYRLVGRYVAVVSDDEVIYRR